MPHDRPRLATDRLLKKLRFSPVVAIQGARQTGKSFLARELIRQQLPEAKYFSFDQQSVKAQAQTHPHSFLEEQPNARPFIIDEAQKVPEIFDAIKYQVDQRRVPGTYLLLGSTEFSILSQIRESLTGRMGRVRLFPMTLVETLDLGKTPAHSRAKTMHYLKNGGMPGMFAIRDGIEQTELMRDWIELVCMRDIHQFGSLKLDSELAFSILEKTANLEEPTQAAIAAALKVDGRRIGSHLRALCELFVLQRLDPHPSGTGKPIYLPLDVGLAHHLGASLMRRLHIFLMNERFCQHSYREHKKKLFYYYRSTGKKFIHLVEHSIGEPPKAFQVVENERVKKTDAELMRAFLAKNEEARGVVYGPLPDAMKVSGISFQPWESFQCSARSRG